MVAAVAAGAFAAAGQTMLSDHQADASGTTNFGPFPQEKGASAAFGSAAAEQAPNGTGSGNAAAEVLPVTKATDTDAERRKLDKSQHLADARAEAAAAEAEARRPKVIRPAEGQFTSGFGGRWGTMHYGIDFSHAKGTPIMSVSDGEVIEAGPASGFGQWVRVQHDDGTITVYGHVDTITARQGHQVRAGEQIATMGNRGFSTGTHLHFEVWNPSGKKINPKPWLEERGVPVG